MFSGLMSRCAMPASCTAERPPRISAVSRKRFLRWDRFFGETVGQGHTDEVLHDHEGHVARHTEVEDLNDVAVLNRRGDLGLSEESLPKLLIPLPEEKLDCDRLLEAQMLGSPDDGHPAFTDDFLESVATVEHPTRPWRIRVDIGCVVGSEIRLRHQKVFDLRMHRGRSFVAEKVVDLGVGLGHVRLQLRLALLGRTEDFPLWLALAHDLSILTETNGARARGVGETPTCAPEQTVTKFEPGRPERAKTPSGVS